MMCGGLMVMDDLADGLMADAGDGCFGGCWRWPMADGSMMGDG